MGYQYFIDSDGKTYLQEVPIGATEPVMDIGCYIDHISISSKKKYKYIPVYLEIYNYKECMMADSLRIKISCIGKSKLVHGKGYTCNSDGYIIIKPNKPKMKFNVRVSVGDGKNTFKAEPLYILYWRD